MVRLAIQKPKRPADCILFRAEKIVITQGIVDLNVTAGILQQLVTRHYRGDWGVCDPHDIRENELALASPLRLWSVFIMPGMTAMVWVITEADRSATTILLPEEY